MLTSHMELLLSLARAGLQANVPRMTTAQLSDSASALGAGESWLVVQEHIEKARASQAPASPPEGQGG